MPTIWITLGVFRLINQFPNMVIYLSSRLKPINYLNNGPENLNDLKVLKIIIFNIRQCWPKISLIFHGCVNSALSVSAHHYGSDTIRVKNINTWPEEESTNTKQSSQVSCYLSGILRWKNGVWTTVWVWFGLVLIEQWFWINFDLF